MAGGEGVGTSTKIKHPVLNYLIQDLSKKYLISPGNRIQESPLHIRVRLSVRRRDVRQIFARVKLELAGSKSFVRQIWQ